MGFLHALRDMIINHLIIQSSRGRTDGQTVRQGSGQGGEVMMVVWLPAIH
jgi:hypothetical protein